MAFSIQNDTGQVAGANAYIAATFFKTYHGDRGAVEIVDSTFTDPEIEAAIVVATDYIDTRYRYKGERKQSDQPTEFPRIDLFDNDEEMVDGIPPCVQEACAEYTMRQLRLGTLDPDPSRDATGAGIKRKRSKAGPVEQEIEYTGVASYRTPKYPTADRKLVSKGITLSGRNVVRG